MGNINEELLIQPQQIEASASKDNLDNNGSFHPYHHINESTFVYDPEPLLPLLNATSTPVSIYSSGNLQYNSSWVLYFYWN